MNSWLLIILQVLLVVLGAPLFSGVVKYLKCRTQNRQSPSVLQPYRDLRKLLLRKETLCPENASYIFRLTPYLQLAIIIFVCALVPVFTYATWPNAYADVILFIGMLALGRFFLALAGMDIGTAFGGMGSSRELTIAALAEPTIMVAFFTLAMLAHSTNFGSIFNYVSTHSVWLNPSVLFIAFGFALVVIAETGRIPVDNPATHLELTMLHEAMILEYSGKYLGLIEWAAQIKLLLFFILFANLFLAIPAWVLANNSILLTLILSGVLLIFKLLLLALVLVFAEINLAKLRLFRVPLLLNAALVLCIIGLLNYIILEVV